jgi:acetylornithine deacetylase/succinyl-diaminopimelate desuccinylase-like protein
MSSASDRSPERLARTSARIALWSSLTVTVLAAALLHRFAMPATDPAFERAERDQALWLGVEFEQRPEVELLRQLVRFDTSHPDPQEAPMAEWIAARLDALGIAATVERFTDGRANLWAIIEGASPRAVVLHGHLDVEPLAEHGDWKFPPLSARIDGPWIYGRGMYDMKSLLAAELLAFEATARRARRGERLERSLMLLFTSSEETGSDTGTRWILEEHPELVERMDVVLTEGGVVEATGPRDIKYWGIEFAQKRFAHFELCADERADLEDLRRRMLEIGTLPPEVQVPPEVVEFFAAYGPTRTLELYRRLLAEPQRLPLEPDRYRRLTPFLKAVLADVVFPFEPEPADGGGWRMKTVAHLLPGRELEPLLARGLPDWLAHGVTRTPAVLRGAEHGSPVDHSDFATLRRAIEHHHPGVPVGPYFLPVTHTDARFFREVGVRAYGIAPFALMPTETTGIGGPDERMQLPAYLAGLPLVDEMVEDLLAAAP